MLRASKGTRTGAARATRRPLVLVFLVAIAGCGSSDEKPSTKGTGGSTGVAGSAGARATGGTPGSGGSGGSGGNGPGGDPSVCHPSNFSTAPLECLQDWSHATAKYTAKCKADGGYQARCEPYDTILFDSGGRSVRCYYESTTGNLIGARSTMGAGDVCVAFDTAFAEPELTTCVPAAGGCTGMP